MKRTLSNETKKRIGPWSEALDSFIIEKNLSEAEVASMAHVDEKVLHSFLELEDDIDMFSFFKILKALDVDLFTFSLRLASDEDLEKIRKIIDEKFGSSENE